MYLTLFCLLQSIYLHAYAHLIFLFLLNEGELILANKEILGTCIAIKIIVSKVCMQIPLLRKLFQVLTSVNLQISLKTLNNLNLY